VGNGYECVQGCVKKVKKIEKVKVKKVESNLWKEKVVKGFNDETNLSKENFPSL
jgi:hypothetical protein